MDSSVTGRNRRCGHFPQDTARLSHRLRTHSLAQTGLYPALPVLRLSNRRG